jgi:hypothetical protein
MSSIRFFSGGRDMGKRGIASEHMRFELSKKGKMPTADRYKRIMKKKLEENKQKAMAGKTSPFGMPLNIQAARKMSKRTEQVLKELAERKARKEAKAQRQMVIIQARNFPNGQINKKGQLFDIAGNIVARVNPKTGRLTTEQGTFIGKYKPKSYFTTIMLQDTINKFSPYYLQQRKLQMMQQQGMINVTSWGPMGDDVINVMGRNTAPVVEENTDSAMFGNATSMGPRQNIGMTAWGARSDNAWGTFADNAWGQSADNVWGGNSTDVWGGVGVGGLWGQKGPHIWGTGSGKNFLRAFTNAVAIFFGLKTKAGAETLRSLRQVRGATATNRTTAASTRTAPSGPTRTGR